VHSWACPVHSCPWGAHSPRPALPPRRPRPIPHPQSVPRTVAAAIESDVVKPLDAWLAAYDSAKARAGRGGASRLQQAGACLGPRFHWGHGFIVCSGGEAAVSGAQGGQHTGSTPFPNSPARPRRPTSLGVPAAAAAAAVGVRCGAPKGRGRHALRRPRATCCRRRGGRCRGGRGRRGRGRRRRPRRGRRGGARRRGGAAAGPRVCRV
jgi:hypothetical protein